MTAYVWNRQFSNRKIIYTGKMAKTQTRYMKFLSLIQKLVAGATFVVVVKVLVMMFGV